MKKQAVDCFESWDIEERIKFKRGFDKYLNHEYDKHDLKVAEILWDKILSNNQLKHGEVMIMIARVLAGFRGGVSNER